jgi:hypothetical protein
MKRAIYRGNARQLCPNDQTVLSDLEAEGPRKPENLPSSLSAKNGERATSPRRAPNDARDTAVAIQTTNVMRPVGETLLLPLRRDPVAR